MLGPIATDESILTGEMPLPRPMHEAHEAHAQLGFSQTLTWKMSRWPWSMAFCRLANFSTLSVISMATVSLAFSLMILGVTLYLSEAPGLTVASTAPFSVLVTWTVCV